MVIFASLTCLIPPKYNDLVGSIVIEPDSSGFK